MPCDGVVSECCGGPRCRQVGVGHRLERGEGLRRNDEERGGRIEAIEGDLEIGAVHVGHETSFEVDVDGAPKCEGGHLGSEEGAPDADVDHVGDPLAGGTNPGTRANLVAEGSHGIEHRVNVGCDVMAVDHERRPLREPKGSVDHPAILRGVDPLTGEHCVSPLLESDLSSQRHQVVEHMGVQQVLR